MKTTKLRKVFDLNYMIKGNVYLLIAKNENGVQESYGILKIISTMEAVFVTIYGEIKVTPDEIGNEMDIKELRIEAVEELENVI